MNLKLVKFIPGPIIPCKMSGKDYDINLINFLYNINRIANNFRWARIEKVWKDYGKALDGITPAIAETLLENQRNIKEYYHDYEKYVLRGVK